MPLSWQAHDQQAARSPTTDQADRTRRRWPGRHRADRQGTQLPESPKHPQPHRHQRPGAPRSRRPRIAVPPVDHNHRSRLPRPARSGWTGPPRGYRLGRQARRHLERGRISDEVMSQNRGHSLAGRSPVAPGERAATRRRTHRIPPAVMNCQPAAVTSSEYPAGSCPMT